MKKSHMNPYRLGNRHTGSWKGIKVELDELTQFIPKNADEKLTELLFIAKKTFH